MILDLNSRLAILTHSAVVAAAASDCCRPDIGVGDVEGGVDVDDDWHKIVFVLIQNLTNLQRRISLLALLLLLLLPRRRSTMEDGVAGAAAAVDVGVVLLLSTF